VINILNIFTFLLSISVSSLAILSIVPKISLIVTLSLLATMSLNVFFNTSSMNGFNFNFVKEKYKVTNGFLFPFFSILPIFFWMIFKSFEENTNITSNVNLFLMHFLFVFFILFSLNDLKKYIKAYIILAFIMSTSGVLANLLLIFDIVSPGSHYINLNDLTNGSFGRDRGMENSYVFPYFLGLILTGDGLFNIGGLNFYRISGWAHEPTSATLFIMPAALLLIHSNIFKNKFLRFGMLIMIATFWTFSMAVGSIIALIFIYIFYIISTLYINYFPKKISILTMLSILVLTMLVVFFSDFIVSASIFATKFGADSLTMQVAIKELTWFVPNANTKSVYYLVHISLWVIIAIFLFVALKGISTRKFVDVYSFILLYIIVHTMKGSQEGVFTLLFVFFWLFCAYYLISESEKDVINN
jgi:hypothetical protein